MRTNRTEKIRPLRVCLFIDFSNFTLSLKKENEKFRADWYLLRQVFVKEAGRVVGASAPVSYEAMHVYGSYDLS